MSKNKIENLFNSKIVSFEISGSSDTLVLMNIKEININNRLFITGIIPEGSTCNNWAEGLTASIVWKSVLNYMVFDNLSDYISRLELSDSENAD